MNVGILIFDEVELLDMAGPYEVFTTAARIHARSQPAGTPPLFTVFTLARGAEPVHARAGLRLQPDRTLDDHPPLDCAIVPGGVVDAELGQAALMDWIAVQAGTARVLASVCTGALLLAQAGVLDGLEATTHWEDVDDLRALRPDLRVVEGRRWVDTGRIVSSAGISAGIDMSLHLVERLQGRELALRTARQLAFDWTEAA
ncbi:DJ-1/PfpI family protein [Mitsuaria sp. WAJ17]|uniref:DJ-1/PfpI family protein n=1 Tax=Mitsuaria sp. WAJ17 TaxID=2761452 RepID=UPI001602A602|nr:DJ-1/PfpI family protein [Mitsuaria sp. WAJ17]MBB2483632.1 DJ-1/PfpI family protein [Mitsuaria sp. WAJ17]